jgi:hypothetical protein
MTQSAITKSSTCAQKAQTRPDLNDTSQQKYFFFRMGMGGGMGMMGMGGGMMGMGGGGGAGVSGGKRPEARPGDWDCPRCYNLNFSSRSVLGAPASVFCS